MRKFVIAFIIIFYSVRLYGQAVTGNITGKVSFISTQNVYVKFISTTGINAGDTLFIETTGTLVPALKVTDLSSASCVCTLISDKKLSVNDQLTAKNKSTYKKTEEKAVPNASKPAIVTEILAVTEKNPDKTDAIKQKIRGNISAYSYSSFSANSKANATRLRYNFSLDARNINNSKFSVESYISFNHKLGNWSAVKKDLFNALKVYSLNVRYDLNKTTQISLGRKINLHMSSMGAMDGLQIEKSVNKFSFGAVAGTRPDFTNYGFNSKLFQYGAYLAFNTVTPDTYNETSAAFMQQTNNGKTDRRFLYFQHSNSLIKNLYFMGTFEVDLYTLESDSLKNYTPKNTFNITGLYLSLRYKVTKKLTLTGTWDERKNVMYYETYKSFIDRILESEMRHSIRLQADYRITNNLVFGVQSGSRFIKSDPHPSKNIYGYLSYYQIPGINISATLSGTYFESNYLNSTIYGINFTKDLFKGKFSAGLGYHYMNYRYNESLMNSKQHVVETNLYWQFAKTMSFSVNYEGTFEKQNKYHLVFFQLRKRF